GAEFVIEYPPRLVGAAHFPPRRQGRLALDLVDEGEDRKEHLLKGLLVPREQSAGRDREVPKAGFAAITVCPSRWLSSIGDDRDAHLRWPPPIAGNVKAPAMRTIRV